MPITNEDWNQVEGSWSISRGPVSYHLLSRPARAGGMRLPANEWMVMSIEAGIEVDRYVLGICMPGVAVECASRLIETLEEEDEVD